MGCAGSVPLELDEHGQPPRTQHEPDAAQLVLTTRGSSNQLVLAEHSRLAAHMPNVPLTLASHPGLAIVTTGPNSGPHMCMWMVAPLGVGSAHNAVTATLRPDDFLVYTHGGPPGKVLDVAHWRYEDGNKVNFVGHTRNPHKTFFPAGERPLHRIPSPSLRLTPTTTLDIRPRQQQGAQLRAQL